MTTRTAISALGLGAVLLAGALCQRPVGRADYSLAVPGRNRSGDRTVESDSLVVVPRTLTTRVEGSKELGSSTPLESADVRATVEELAAILRSGGESPRGWEQRLRALARELEDVDGELLSTASDPELDPYEHLAAAELVRERQGGGGGRAALPAATLRSLRSLLDRVEGEPLAASVAARALAALGSDADLVRLLDLLAGREGPARREAATWGLSRSCREWVVHELVELALTPVAADVAQSSLIALGELSESWSRDVALSGVVAARLARIPGDPGFPTTVRLRALRTMTAWDCDVALPVLRGCAQLDDASQVREAAVDALVALDMAEARAGLEAVLLDPGSAVELRRDVAFGLVRRELALDPAIRAQLEDTLEYAAVDTDVHVRRRALDALGELGGRGVFSILADAARHDPDARVRQAAIASLGRHAGEPARELLAELAERDPAAGVRRLARHEAENRAR